MELKRWWKETYEAGEETWAQASRAMGWGVGSLAWDRFLCLCDLPGKLGSSTGLINDLWADCCSGLENERS
ncbi:hypothetical protein BRADI_3g57536v3 [Brachypodium distachyon]|uniref:Uncharacterized protein n=1 Tax=Brachypodium distachyon TaxID=15368 RepID=A0A2K2D5J9_BRADI|nr:hypothetical protein BRADI_3g57536v3 [Brachypodium distachyon]